MTVNNTPLFEKQKGSLSAGMMQQHIWIQPDLAKNKEVHPDLTPVKPTQELDKGYEIQKTKQKQNRKGRRNKQHNNTGCKAKRKNKKVIQVQDQ